jgi:hypothetical protein
VLVRDQIGNLQRVPGGFDLVCPIDVSALKGGGDFRTESAE